MADRGAHVRVIDHQCFEVDELSVQDIGRTAAGSGAVLHELTPSASTLEDVPRTDQGPGGDDMTAALNAELLKLVSTRVLRALASGALPAAFIAFGLMPQSPRPWNLAASDIGQIGSVSALSSGLFCLILGMRSFTDEFRYGTVVHTAFSAYTGLGPRSRKRSSRVELA